MKIAIGSTHAPPSVDAVLVPPSSASVHFVPVQFWFVPAPVRCAEVSVGDPLRPRSVHRYPSHGGGVWLEVQPLTAKNDGSEKTLCAFDL